jgi:hypothetical protein
MNAALPHRKPPEWQSFQMCLLVHRLKRTPLEERTVMTKTRHADRFLEGDGAFVISDADVMNGDVECMKSTFEMQ